MLDVPAQLQQICLEFTGRTHHWSEPPFICMLDYNYIQIDTNTTHYEEEQLSHLLCKKCVWSQPRKQIHLKFVAIMLLANTITNH